MTAPDLSDPEAALARLNRRHRIEAAKDAGCFLGLGLGCIVVLALCVALLAALVFGVSYVWHAGAR